MRNRGRDVLLVLMATAFSALFAVAQSQQDGRPTITAVALEADERITLDGNLEEAVWDRAEPATDFLQQDPDFGAPATERTEVRIAFDHERLYMGVICFDSEPDNLLGFQRRRDEFLQADDRFMWVMDTYLDARGGYYFEINPSGLMGDSLMGANNQNNRQWDGIWTAKVRRSEIGWAAEIEIPFRTLNFDPDVAAWGINFQRTVRRKNEESLWTGHPRNQGLRRMANSGLLKGIREASQGKGIDFKPYILGTAFTAPGRGKNDTTWQGKPGLDVFYSPTPRLRANFTLNTDFAQTEVDQRQVNLTRYSLFFPEKRDFFLEGANFFDFRSTAEGDPDTRAYPFFSRNIGLNGGEPQKIVYGVKLTGQVGRQDIEHSKYGREKIKEPPAEDFTVLRLKRRWLSQSYFGGMLTRRDPSGNAKALYTMGVDGLFSTRHFLETQNFEGGAFLMRTSTPEGISGDRLAFGGELSFPNDPWDSSFAFREVQGNFDPAVGFVSQVNYRRYNPSISYALRPQKYPWIRRVSFDAAVDFQTDLSNETLTRKFEFQVLEVESQSGDNFSISITPERERLVEDFEIHEGIILPAGGKYDFTRYHFEASTANRRIVAVAPEEVEFGHFYSGSRLDYSLGLDLRLRTGLIIYSSAEWNRVNLAEGRFQTRLYRISPELQFSPWIALVNSIQYDDVSGTLGWQSRFRWILKPGNDFYFVYTHNWRNDPVLGFETLERRAATKLVYTYRF